MLSLNRMLVTEIHPRKKKDDRAGMKTPLTLKMNFSGKLENVFVTDTKGTPVLVKNKGEDILSNFFELDVAEQDDYHTFLVHELYVVSANQEWGNVAAKEKFTATDLYRVQKFFKTHGIDFYSTFVGYKGYQNLVSTNLLKGIDKTTKIQTPLSEDDLLQVSITNYCIGTYYDRPVFYNPLMDGYIAFTSNPENLGILTRIGDYVAVYIHNPERGIVIYNIEEKTDE